MMAFALSGELIRAVLRATRSENEFVYRFLHARNVGIKRAEL